MATSTSDLLSYIDDLFDLSLISNYRTLLSDLYMKPTTKFTRQGVDLYIQAVSKLLDQYPAMFDVDHGGTTPKLFTEVFLEGLFPLPFRNDVKDKGSESFSLALKAIYKSYKKFECYTEVLALSSPPTFVTSTYQGKIAYVAVSTNNRPLCDNCKLTITNNKARDCTQLCRLCPGLAPHKFFRRIFVDNICL